MTSLNSGILTSSDESIYEIPAKSNVIFESLYIFNPGISKCKYTIMIRMLGAPKYIVASGRLDSGESCEVFDLPKSCEFGEILIGKSDIGGVLTYCLFGEINAI